ncbi:MAG: hypothetical protein C0442_11000, partial [Chlorobiaceae bacterium]|nr:hypothetical protein [Chlorobiaceae bacterium]
MKKNPNPKQQSQPQSSSISGIQKAALLMIALNVDTASEVLKYLDTAEVELISTEITKAK